MHSDVMDQLARLNISMQAMEARVGQGGVTVKHLEAVKSALDDLRLRLWGILIAGGENPEAFQQRFRMRRAAELCRQLGKELRAGGIPNPEPELSDAMEAAEEFLAAAGANSD